MGNVNSKLLAEKYDSKFQSDHKRSIKGFREDVIANTHVDVIKHQAYHAEQSTMELIAGQPELQYELLWDFVVEIKRTNPRFTIKIDTRDGEGVCQFDMMYMCLNALKVGSVSTYRPVLELMGAS